MNIEKNIGTKILRPISFSPSEKITATIAKMKNKQEKTFVILYFKKFDKLKMITPKKNEYKHLTKPLLVSIEVL